MKITRAQGASALVGLTLALGAGPAAGQDRIVGIERRAYGGDPSKTRAPETRAPWLARPGDVIEEVPLREDLEIIAGDRIQLFYPWVVRTRLRQPGGSLGRLALAADVRALDGPSVLGPPAGDGIASFEIERSGAGSRVRLHRGALFLTRWKAGAVCIVAAGACATNTGTAYALRVDSTGRAYLGVTEDAVEIAWWAGSREQPPAGECGAVSTGTPCRQLASARTIWTWTETEPPRRWDDDNRALVGSLDLGGMYAALERAVDQNGHDIWDNSLLKKPLFWITTGAVLGGVACIIWCGGDDVTGTVIINP